MSPRIVLLAAFAFAACTATRPAPPAPPRNTGGDPAAHELLASIERTACFGTCPMYRLTVYRDGTLEYEGEQFVKLTGKHTDTISPEQVAELDRLFAANGYFDLKDAYDDASVTDMPSCHTAYAQGGRTKTIRHYLGDMGAPEALGRIEDGFDAIVHVENWIGTREERDKLRDGY